MEAQTTQVADTPLGPVQYATVGEGPPVLVVHGSPGGYDQGIAMAHVLVAAGLRAIVLSRPGYLGTELGDRRTIDQQADLEAALLDHSASSARACWAGRAADLRATGWRCATPIA